MLVVPKTCDHQTAANRARNQYYARMKNATSAEEREILKIEYAGVFLGNRREHRLRIWRLRTVEFMCDFKRRIEHKIKQKFKYKIKEKKENKSVRLIFTCYADKY